MAAAAASRAPLVLGAAVLGAVASVIAWRRWVRRRAPTSSSVSLGDAGKRLPDAASAVQAPQSGRRSKAGGMKLSRLRQMLDDMAEAMSTATSSCPSASSATSLGSAGSAVGCANSEGDDGRAVAVATWDEQVARERRTMEAAVQLLRGVRQSAVHRKLPHFHVVDRQLRNIEEQLAFVGMSTQGFWRYGRDLPMDDLLRLPLLQLASTGGEGALLPVTLGFVKHTAELGLEEMGDSATVRSSAEDEALLGVAPGAQRDEVESAYRRRSRHLHRHGQCTNVAGFNALTSARNRCLARLSSPMLRAYGGGGDLLAHYLLIGTDPSESRYREYSSGILDSLHRGRLLHCIQVLQWPTWDIPLTWGDEVDVLEFGGANHLGASG